MQSSLAFKESISLIILLIVQEDSLTLCIKVRTRFQVIPLTPGDQVL